jgi:3-methyladenine DNA glycosylase AlkD
MTYLQFLTELKDYAEEEFAAFQRKLIPTKQKILGVRTPAMRQIAKKYKDCLSEIFAFPDEYYEVTFIKLSIVAMLSFHEFLAYLEQCVQRIDNWATCDSFKAKCIYKHKEEFLDIIAKIFEKNGEFAQRYVLVTLLYTYVEDKYLPILQSYLQRADTTKYYVHMAAAWLLAEVLIQYYDIGVLWLKEGWIDIKTHNKAIQKARESYRLHKEQKEELSSLKIKSKR